MTGVVAAGLGLAAIAGSGISGIAVASGTILSGALTFVAYHRLHNGGKALIYGLAVLLLLASCFFTIWPVTTLLATDESDTPSVIVDPGSASDITSFPARAYDDALNDDQLPRLVDRGSVAHMEWLSKSQINAGTTSFKFTLRGQHHKPVYLRSITLKPVERTRPPAGTLVYLQGEGAGEIPNIGFDIDSDDLEARTVDQNGQIGSDHFLDSTQISLGFDEPVTISAKVVTSTCYCKFVFEVEASDGTRIDVGDPTKPWSVSAFADEYEQSYLVATKYKGKPTTCHWPTFGISGPMSC